MNQTISIHWFRQDLRLADNPALSAAADRGQVLPVYILDDINAGAHRPGAASRWWLHHSLDALNKSLGGKLLICQGNPEHLLPELARQHGATAVFWNRCLEPWQTLRDTRIKSVLQQQHHLDVVSFNGSLLWEPWEILKKDGTPYRVFTPYYRSARLIADRLRRPLPVPAKMRLLGSGSKPVDLADLRLLPRISWDRKLLSHWRIGEQGAAERLKIFLESGLDNYKSGRDRPADGNVSRLSPHLHFGEISPNQVWYAANDCNDSEDLEHFRRELCWREFSHNLLYYCPDLPHSNLQTKFDAFPWESNTALLASWQTGQTGYPLVDAGMRELWETGYMHNRVRMITGSFLVKNLLLHWHHGANWFWDCLVDADLANNSASWQWVAGCGADAAPYFRIFNPVIQGQKFDPTGAYTRRFVPELAHLPNKYLFNPWEAPQTVLDEAGINLGENYPQPVVGLQWSRQRALAAYQLLKDRHL